MHWKRYILKVFQNKLLRRKIGPNREKQTGESRKLHSKGLNNCYFSPSHFGDEVTTGVTYLSPRAFQLLLCGHNLNQNLEGKQHESRTHVVLTGTRL
jgi:hypothetical protein